MAFPWRKRRREFEAYNDRSGGIGRLLERAVGFVVWIVRSLVDLIFGGIKWVFFDAPMYLFRTLRRFVFSSRLREKGWNLLYGLPAAAAGVAIVVVTYLINVAPAGAIAARYRLAAAAARDEGNLEAAILYYSQLRLLESGSVEPKYQLALLYEKAGRLDRARFHMSEIAPEDSLGEPKAHLWLAVNLLRQRNRDKTAIETARKHLLRVLQVEPSQITANARMAEVDVAGGRLAEAEQRLRFVGKADPAVRLNLAQVLALENRREEALVEAAAAESHLKERLRQKLDNDEIRQRLADALAFRGDYRQTLEVLKEGLVLHGAKEYAPLVARTYFAWGLATSEKSLRWTYFDAAFKQEPTSPETLGGLLKIALRDPGDELALRAMLERNRLQSAAAADAETLLGLLSVHRGNTGEIRAHLERAMQLDPATPRLATEILRAAELSSTAALELVDAAQLIWPKDFELRRLRGETLAAAGRWAESLVQLDAIALDRDGDRPLHALLADVCRHLGLIDQEERHRRLSGESSASTTNAGT